MPPHIKLRLSIMMFLQYFMLGSTLPVLSLYLKEHMHFSGSEVGLILSMSAAAGFLSPVVSAVIADRLISAERLLSIFHLIAATAMILLSIQTGLIWTIILYLVYAMAYAPSIALTNSITFHHHPDQNHKFVNIRVWGTIGWVAVAWLFSYCWLNNWGAGSQPERLPDALKLSAITSVILALYALTLPKAMFKKKHGKITLIPRESINTFFQPKILFISAVILLTSIFGKIYFFGAAPFFQHIGIPAHQIMPLMSLGQIVEIFAMYGLGFLLTRKSIKTLLLIGISAEIWRFTTLSMTESMPVLISGVLCHGIGYSFFMTTALLYVDRFCSKEARTGLHQIFSFVNLAIGNLVGNLLAGSLMDYYVTNPAITDYSSFWLIPLCLAAFVGVLILAFFRE